MAIVNSRTVVDKTQGLARTLALDLSAGTYTFQVDGQALTAGSTTADPYFGTITTSAGTFTFSYADIARVALGDRLPPAMFLNLLGWLIMRLIQASVTLNTILTTAPRGPDN